MQKEKIKTHLSKDLKLAPLIAEFDFPQDRIALSKIYPSLLRSIVGQQVSTKAAAAVYARFLVSFELDSTDPLVAPKPTDLVAKDPEILRNAGLSWNKVKYVQALAQYFIQNPDAEQKLQEMSNQEAITELTKIKGVGQWTAEMMLLFAMGRTDVLPLDDLAIFQSIASIYKIDQSLKKKEQKDKMTKIAEHWRPYRSFACLYLYKWRHKYH